MPHSTIIDCHTHCYPPEVIQDPRGWARAHREHHWAELVDPTDRKSIQGWSNPDRMLAAMDAAGVDQAVLLGWYWEHEATCRWHNRAIADWVRHAPDRFIGFASIFPNGSVVDQLENAKALGLRGVGELHFSVQQFSASCTAWIALADWCIANNWPVNLHVTEAAGHDHPGSIATPFKEIVQMAEQSPELKLILAHLGGGLPFFELNPRLRTVLQNVYYDTAAIPLLYDIGILKQVIELVGVEKLLIGSDYPLRIYPKHQKQPDMLRFLEHIRAEANLDDQQLNAVLGDNFRRLIG
ncbi:MAG: amidohydrolase family protein [Coraliomargarita sp.]